jgi:succinoglycan biosynthesis protein ExoM
MKISLCIATYKRAGRLAALLSDLDAQQLLPDEVIIVDNDPAGSARPVVEAHAATHEAFALKYAIQPERGIAITRNLTVAMASGDWVAFIDDDERAPAAWLAQLLEAARRHQADGVLGPVVPVVPESAPDWIRRGSFYDFPRMQTGAIVPLNRLRFGNVILRGEPLRAEPGPFDVAYGLMTGEDGDLLSRMANKGARIIWCDEAIVHEPIEPARLSFRWILRRALSGGQEFARKSLDGTYARVTLVHRARLFTQALAQMLVALALAVVSLPAGRHRAAGWLVRASANLGKLSVFWGWRYSLYA